MLSPRKALALLVLRIFSLAVVLLLAVVAEVDLFTRTYFLTILLV